MRVERYDREQHRDTWEAFVQGRACNSHFMHSQRYLEYHGDRFEDGSLLLFADRAEPVALLPANRSGDALVSHSGLSFGGMLVIESFRLEAWRQAFLSLGEYLRGEGLAAFDYRPTPLWYHLAPVEDDIYLIESAGLRPTLQASAICRMDGVFPGNATRRNEARRGGLQVAREAEALPEMMALIEETLRGRHGAKPVHSLAEIAELAGRFPDEIRCYGGRTGDGMLVAGGLLFCSPTTVKLQYVGYAEGHSMSPIYAHLFESEEFRGRCFDFGISIADGGLAPGLFAYKESLGGRLATVRRYLLPTDSAPLA
jgi:hypothetical protein